MDLDLRGDIRLPESFTDADLDRMMAQGMHLRFIPLAPNAREVPARWADLFEQSVPGPGWYAAYDRPLGRDEIALRFMTEPPETVADYFKVLDLVRDEMPGNPRSPVVPANIPEILWVIKRNPQAFYEDELLLASAPAFPEAVSVRLDPHVKSTSRSMHDPFDGAIYPLRRVY